VFLTASFVNLSHATDNGVSVASKQKWIAEVLGETLRE
jgi:hypothetical protein